VICPRCGGRVERETLVQRYRCGACEFSVTEIERQRDYAGLTMEQALLRKWQVSQVRADARGSVAATATGRVGQ